MTFYNSFSGKEINPYNCEHNFIIWVPKSIAREVAKYHAPAGQLDEEALGLVGFIVNYDSLVNMICYFELEPDEVHIYQVRQFLANNLVDYDDQEDLITFDYDSFDSENFEY